MKSSFIIYTQQLEKARKLNMEQRGMLLTAILDYHCGEEVNVDDPLVDMLFSTMRDTFDDNAMKYEDKVNKCREAGRASAAKRAATRSTDVNVRQQTSTVYDNVYDNDNVNENDIVDLDILFARDEEPTVEPPVIVDTTPKTTVHKPEPIPEEQAFAEYMKANYPRVNRMKKPLTLEQYNNLVSKYGTDTVVKCMANLENYSKINNYVSASMTLNNWCSMEKERETKKQTYNNGTNRTPHTVNDPTNLIEQLRQHHAEQKRGESI